jgi:hypothetical protein
MIKHNYNLHKLTNNLTQIVSNKKNKNPLNTSPRERPLLKKEETNKQSLNVECKEHCLGKLVTFIKKPNSPIFNTFMCEL